MQKLSKFFEKYESVLNSPFILFEVKLQDIMLCLAESEIVYEIVSKCLKNYDYQLDKTRLQESKNIYSVLTCDKEYIAFGFSLFYEIFNKKISLSDIIEKYFDGESFIAKYDNFKNNLLIAVKNSLKNIIFEMQKLYKEQSGLQDINLDYKNQKIQELKSLIDNFNFKEQDKEYFNYFYNNLTNQNLKECSLVAIKYMLLSYDNGIELLQKIMEIF